MATLNARKPHGLVGLKAGPYLFRAFGTISVTEKFGNSQLVEPFLWRIWAEKNLEL